MRRELPAEATHLWEPDPFPRVELPEERPMGRYRAATHANPIAASVWDEDERPTRPDGICVELARKDTLEAALDEAEKALERITLI